MVRNTHFTAQIRNPNTRRAYARAASRFSAWCAEYGLDDLQAIEPVHVAAYIETLQLQMTAPSVKLQLAALRVLFAACAAAGLGLANDW